MKHYIPLFVAGLALVACIGTYQGPGLQTVMTTTCAPEASMKGMYDCVNRNWYQPVSAAGLGMQSSVVNMMQTGSQLTLAVQQRKMRDSEAISRWKEAAAVWRQNEIARADAVRRTGALMQQTATEMRANEPLMCHTVMGEVTATTTCY